MLMKESGIKREYCRSPVKPPSKNVWSKLEFHERAHFLRRHLTISNPAAHILARVRLTITDNEPSGRLMVRPGPLSDPSPLPPPRMLICAGCGNGSRERPRYRPG